MLLTDNNIKAELSYAYLHAVAARAGFGCSWGSRHDDGAGVDALVRFKERLAPPPAYTESVIEVQLKATGDQPKLQKGRYPFSLKRDHYDKLISAENGLWRFLVVLFLPQQSDEWLKLTPSQLSLKRCAFWCSLRGAAATTNSTGQTVYLPRQNILSVDGLRALMTRVARKEEWCDGSE